MTIDKQYITFSTGRRVFLSRGSVGLAASNTDERWLFDGSSFTVDFGGAAGVPADVLEPEEAIELADYMIALWHRFRTSVSSVRRYERDSRSDALLLDSNMLHVPHSDDLTERVRWQQTSAPFLVNGCWSPRQSSDAYLMKPAQRFAAASSNRNAWYSFHGCNEPGAGTTPRFDFLS